MISSICRRCHHIREVDGARYCQACAKELRAMERRRPAAPVAVEAAPLVTEEDHVQAGLVRLLPPTTTATEIEKPSWDQKAD